MSEAPKVGYECTGCGRGTGDPEKDLSLLHQAGKISCCPERKMMQSPYVKALQAERDKATAHLDKLIELSQGLIKVSEAENSTLQAQLNSPAHAAKVLLASGPHNEVVDLVLEAISVDDTDDRTAYLSALRAIAEQDTQT